MIGGLLKNVFGKGWFSITPAWLQFAIAIYLRSCTVGWYVVNKGNLYRYFFAFVWAPIVLSQSWPFYILFRIPACSTSHFLREKVLGTRFAACLKALFKVCKALFIWFLFKSLFQRLVFTSEGVRVVIRTVRRCDPVKTAFWLHLRLLRLRSGENYNRFS